MQQADVSPDPVFAAGSGSMIGAILRQAAARTDATLTVVSGARDGTDTLDGIVQVGLRAAAYFRLAGIRADDVAAVQLPAWREWLVACVGIWHAGAVLLLVVSIYGARELAFILRQSRARMVVTPLRLRGGLSQPDAGMRGFTGSVAAYYGGRDGWLHRLARGHAVCA